MILNVHLSADRDEERFDTLISPAGGVATLEAIERRVFLDEEARSYDGGFPGNEEVRAEIFRVIESADASGGPVSVLFTVLGYNAEASEAFARELKERFEGGVRVVFGGQLMPFSERAFMAHPSVDIVCLGDAEVVLPQMRVDRFSSSRYEGWLKDSEVRPVFSGVSYEHFFQIRERLARQKEVAGFSQLVVQGPGGPGCSWAANNLNGACSFCALQNITVMNGVPLHEHFEMEAALQERFGMDRFFDVANQFLPFLRADGNEGWLRSYIDVREQLGVAAGKYAYLTVSSITPEIAALLRQAGVTEAYLGIEHFDAKALASHNKSHRGGNTLKRALDSLKNEGIRFRMGLVLGASPEKPESLQAVRDGMQSLTTDYRDQLLACGVYPLEVIPGSRLFDQARQQGLVPEVFESFARKGFFTAQEQLALNRAYIQAHSPVGADAVYALAAEMSALEQAYQLRRSPRDLYAKKG